MKTFLPILALALLLTVLNAVKPVHIDDTTYCTNAHQLADHPLDPYGHPLLYFSDLLPSLHVLAPPVLPAWLALAVRLFGERPMLWKLWLFPFALAFVASLASLLRRFAPSTANPLLFLVTLSPVILPSLNLMLDLPALALNLTSLVLFLQASDRDSLPRALFAGLIAALAMQTKYTGFLAPAALLAYAVLHRRFLLGFSAAAVAALVFAAWELALVWQYGESHFRYHTAQAPLDVQGKLGLLASFFPILGAVAPTLLLLALTIRGQSRRFLLAAALFVLLPYLFMGAADPDLVDLDHVPLTLTGILFAVGGAAVFLSLAWASWALVQPVYGQALLCPFSVQGRVAWFLVLWVGLEFAGYLALSPFPAVRRIMGFTVAATLLLGYLAEQRLLEQWQRNVLRGLVVVTALLGCVYTGVDYLEARAEQQVAYEAARRVHERDADAVAWYVGYWGFQFYVEEAGMKQVIPEQNLPEGASPGPPSRLRRGDWLVVPDGGIPQQTLDLDRPELKFMEEVSQGDCVPLATLIGYYAGSFPLRHHRGPRIVVRLFRVEADYVPRVSP